MTEPQSPQVFLGRQPILGREQQLLAYELLFRNGVIATANTAEILDATQATTTVIANAFAELSISDSLGPYRAYINVDREFLGNIRDENGNPGVDHNGNPGEIRISPIERSPFFLTPIAGPTWNVANNDNGDRGDANRPVINPRPAQPLFGVFGPGRAQG